MVVYGTETDANPHTALLGEIRRTAGHVAWLSLKIQEAQFDDDLLDAYRPWLNLYQKERDRLARICESAIKLGLSERMVRLEERKAEMIARVLVATLEELDLPAEYAARAPGILRRQLLAIDS